MIFGVISSSQIRYCGREIGATQHVVWSKAPRQIFLYSRTWRLPVFQQCLYIDNQVDKTQRSNSILYKEYKSMLFVRRIFARSV
jgi:hypothetical protein